MAKTKEKLMIIDGNALIHRSFHALPPTMTTKNGQMVNAVYGFASFLIKAIGELKPEYVVLTLDKKGPTFRHKKFKEYKAKRVKAPDELYTQIPIVKEIAKGFNIPIFEQDGFEADDLIGTISKIVDPGIEKIIVTGDMDTLQLVNEHTRIYAMSRGISDSIVYDITQVKQRFGVGPKQIIDYKALRGDPSDNIPGVRGVGEKTAVDLIQRFGSLANLYKALDANQAEISDSVRRKLIEGKDDALMSQNLCRIRTDVKINFHLVDAEFKPVTREAVQDSFERYQFSRLLTQLPKSDSEEGRKAGGQLGLLGETGSVEEEEQQFVKHAWIEVKTVAELSKIVEMLKKTKRLAFRSTVLLNDNNNSSISPDLLVLSDE